MFDIPRRDKNWLKTVFDKSVASWECIQVTTNSSATQKLSYTSRGAFQPGSPRPSRGGRSTDASPVGRIDDADDITTRCLAPFASKREMRKISIRLTQTPSRSAGE
ncbi:hypothetical protein LSAT2_012784, partial [Lamellibrachia satsuma]